jgi:hypothetical protein
MTKLLCRRSFLVAMVAATALSARPSPARADEAADLLKAVGDYNSGHYADAAKSFFDIAEASGLAPEVQFNAESFLAKSLFKLRLYHSALYYDLLIIDVGPGHPGYRDAVQNILDVMDAVGDKAIIPSVLDKEYNENFAKLPKQVIDRVNFIVALWGHQQNKMEDSLAFLEAVKADSEAYPRARYLRAVQFAEAAKSGDSKANDQAAAIFQEVLRLTKAKVNYANLQEMKDLSTLGLARVRFAQGKFQESYELYEKVPRFSRLWRDALFEGAYAAFMNDENGKALGMLHTLHAPVAGDQFVPESWLLKAHIYYFSCLFEESKAALNHLQSTYPKTAEQVKALVDAKLDPEVYYDLLSKGAQGQLEMPANVRNELLVDEGLRGRRSYIVALDDESQRLTEISEWQGSLLQKALSEAVAQQRTKLVKVAGQGIRRALAKIEYVLEDIDGQADIVRLEMADREKNLLESSFDAEKKLGSQGLYRPAMPRHGIEYWDFEGEFWPDELGFYQYTTKNACPAEEASK